MHAALKSRPIRNLNAIESAAFAIVLHESLDPASLAAVCEAGVQFHGELPGAGPSMGVALPHGVVINFEPAPGFSQSAPRGLNRFLAASNGVWEWQLQVEGNLIVVNCRSYTRHEEVWERMRRYILATIHAVPRDFPLAEVGFQVIDRFDYEVGGSPGAYSIREVFAESSPYLTPQALKSGVHWHVFQGWFDGCSVDGTRLLNQLNLSNVDVSDPHLHLSTVIDHRASIRPINQVMGLKALADSTIGDQTILDSCFTALHAANRSVVEQLLTAEKLMSIGIKPGNVK